MVASGHVVSSKTRYFYVTDGERCLGCRLCSEMHSRPNRTRRSELSIRATVGMDLLLHLIGLLLRVLYHLDSLVPLLLVDHFSLEDVFLLHMHPPFNPVSLRLIVVGRDFVTL